ncbi:hypothetical protein TNCV_2512411 [Trichonephila clavipes]|nr:hypothetical protein TNCV_2512411 [Trichonephila clavipes]
MVSVRGQRNSSLPKARCTPTVSRCFDQHTSKGMTLLGFIPILRETTQEVIRRGLQSLFSLNQPHERTCGLNRSVQSWNNRRDACSSVAKSAAFALMSTVLYTIRMICINALELHIITFINMSYANLVRKPQSTGFRVCSNYRRYGRSSKNLRKTFQTVFNDIVYSRLAYRTDLFGLRKKEYLTRAKLFPKT